MRLIGILLLLGVIMPSDLFSQITSGRGYYRQDGSFVIPRNNADPHDVVIVSDKHKIYYKRVYKHANDPLAKSVLGEQNKSLQDFGDMRSGDDLKDDYEGMQGKYEG